MTDQKDYSGHAIAGYLVAGALLVAAAILAVMFYSATRGDGLHDAGQAPRTEDYYVVTQGRYEGIYPSAAGFEQGAPKGRFLRETCTLRSDGDVEDLSVRTAVTTCEYTDITRKAALAGVIASAASYPAPGRPADVG